MDALQSQAINNALIQKISDIIGQWLLIPKTGGLIFGKVQWSDVVNFFTTHLDDLMQFAEGIFGNGTGEEKKALVLKALGVIYDITSADFLPIFLKPFSNHLKSLLIDVIASNLIDFLVSKYNKGGWNQGGIGGTPTS